MPSSSVPRSGRQVCAVPSTGTAETQCLEEYLAKTFGKRGHHEKRMFLDRAVTNWSLLTPRSSRVPELRVTSSFKSGIEVSANQGQFTLLRQPCSMPGMEQMVQTLPLHA